MPLPRSIGLVTRHRSSLGSPGAESAGDEFARPRRYGAAAGPRGVEAVLRGQHIPQRERAADPRRASLGPSTLSGR